MIGTRAIFKAQTNLSRSLLLFFGLLALALLLFPLQPLTVFYQTNFFFALFGYTALLILTSLLILNSIRPQASPPQKMDQPYQPYRSSSPFVSGALLLLGNLLLLVSSYRLYWFFVWDSTYDPIGVLVFFPLLGAATACSVTLLLLLSKRTKATAWIYFFVFPLLVISIYALAAQVDFRQLTAQRMQTVGRAVEAFHVDQGFYPQDLRQLVPRYLLSLPKPVFINSQDWCYQASDNGFQLACLTRDHWSSPYLSAVSYHPSGDPADLERLCTDQIDLHRQRQPWSSWQP
jgi:hypothetical protein